MRPGNYVYFDRTQVGLGATPLGGCALTVLSTVVSRPAANRVIFDAGSKTLTNDGVRGFTPMTGYGLVFPDLETAQPDGSILIERLSEEHAVARVLPGVPPHPRRPRADSAESLLYRDEFGEQLVLTDGDAVVDRIPVAARGRNY